MVKIRILLADDHAVVRAGIRSTLDGISDFEVVGEIGNGPALKASLALETVDLLIVDVAMPDFEPISAIKELRVSYPKVKILVISAYDDEMYVKGLLQVGVHGYHLKDQPLSDMVLAIRRVLAGERWLSSPLIGRLVSQRDSWTPQLTPRQVELLSMLQEGLDNHGIASRTGLSVKTVENHLTRLYRALNVQSRLEAVNVVANHPNILSLSGHMASRSLETRGAQSSRGPTVLLVDDNLRFRQRLRRTIGGIRDGSIIYEANRIDAALRIAEQTRPDLALIDVVLGEESGLTCTRRLHAIAPAVRVILISAYPDREFHREGLAAGAIAFVDKRELDSAALRQILDDLVKQDTF